ncbi:hypothetical protein ABPG74_012304 [Tetrahymena malaccensis]
MNTILLSILAITTLSTIGLTIGLYLETQQQDLYLEVPSPYIRFIDETEVDQLIMTLQGKSDSEQLKSIQSFTLEQHKFYSSDQILKILVILKESVYPQYNQVRNYAIEVMKPYIGPLTTAQAQQILKIISASDGIASGVVVSQIYDLYGNTENQQSLNMTLATYDNMLYKQIINQQYAKNFYYNFLITSEGKHVAFIIDQSKTMATVAQIRSDGTNLTRYDLLRQFSQNRNDIFQSFTAFSYILMGNYTDFKCNSCPTGSYEQRKAMNSFVLNVLHNGGESNIYQQLNYFLSNPYNQITDLYIWSDGIITEGTSNINDFVNLIKETNSQRRNNIRINTVSFLVGGNEPQSVKDNSTQLLKTLADVTGGTFIQVSS